MADGEFRSAVLQTISQPGARGAAWTTDDARERGGGSGGWRVSAAAARRRARGGARKVCPLPTATYALAPAAPLCSPTILTKHTLLRQSEVAKPLRAT